MPWSNAVEGGDEFDLIRSIAEPLPVEVIAELLGIPPDDRHLLRPWSAEICLMYELNPSDGLRASGGEGQRGVHPVPA